MAFNPYDYVDDPLLRMLGQSSRRAAGALPDLTEEEEEGALTKLGKKALGGLGTVADVLGTVGGFVTTSLSGENPFPGILDPSQRKYGRDMLESWGMVGPNEEGFDGGDVAGFAADVLLDPLTYATFGASALAKSGRVAKAAGALPKAVKEGGKLVKGTREARLTDTLADVLAKAPDKRVDLARAAGSETALDELLASGEPLGAAMGIGLPFMEPIATVGTGPLAKKWARGLDVAGDWLGKTAPVRYARGLFDAPVQGHFGKIEQDIAEKTFDRYPQAKAAARMQNYEQGKLYDDLFQEFKPHIEQAMPATQGPLPEMAPFGMGDVVRAGDRGNYGRVEGIGQDAADVFFKNPQTGSEATVSLPFEQLSRVYKAGTNEAAQFAEQKARSVFDRLARMTHERQGNYGDAIENILPGLQVTPQMGTRLAGLADDIHQAKNAVYSSVTGKGVKGEWISEEGAFAHAARYLPEKTAQEVEKMRLTPTKAGSTMARSDPLRNVPAEIVNAIAIDPQARGAGAAGHILDQYGRFLGEGYDSIDDHAKALADWVTDKPKRALYTRTYLQDNLKYTEEMLKLDKAADVIHETLKGYLGTEGVPLAKAFSAAGMDPDASLRHFASLYGADAAKGSVPVEVAKAIRGYTKIYESKPWATAIGKAIDTFNKTFTRAVTLPWVAYHFRNHTGGQFINLASGEIASLGDIAMYGKQYADSARLLKKPNKDVLAELNIYGVWKPHIGSEGVPLTQMPTDIMKPGNPLNVRQSYQEVAQDVATDPSKIPLMDRARRGYGTVMKTGEKANQNVEFMNRVPMYMYLTREKKWTREAAAAKVNELQFDYDALAPFERDVMKKLVPFYSFTRKVIPLTVRNLVEHPGGLTAQTMRLQQKLRQDEGFLPEHLGQGLAVPLGEQESGAHRYLTSFGLPHEQAFNLVNPRSVSKTGMELLGQTTPLLKGPLEMFTNRQFYTGRELHDLHSTTGLPLLDQVAMNSPAARFLSAGKLLADERKGVGAKATNLLTGVRVSDIDMEKQSGIAARNLLDELLRGKEGIGRFERPYLKPGALETMSAEDIERYRLYQALDQKAKKAAKAQK